MHFYGRARANDVSPMRYVNGVSWGRYTKKYFKFYLKIIVTFLYVVFKKKYIVTLFCKKLRIKIVVSLLRESGPCNLKL